MHHSRVIVRSTPSGGRGHVFVGLGPPERMMFRGRGRSLRRVRSSAVRLLMRVMLLLVVVLMVVVVLVVLVMVHGVAVHAVAAGPVVVASRGRIVTGGGWPRAVSSSCKSEPNGNRYRKKKKKLPTCEIIIITINVCRSNSLRSRRGRANERESGDFGTGPKNNINALGIRGRIR